ncbi:Glycerophosphocholine phosphodiesterase [Podosphaera aphanis]|nr:Glycerophosphocholine phosphodiesterase [Podosphaera aphanis]
MDRVEADDLIKALLELRGQLRKLQWFGEINRRGFVKITKKVDKRIPNNHTQQRYIASRVNQRHFASDADLLAMIADTNEWLSILGEVKSNRNAHSVQAKPRPVTRALSKNMVHFPDHLLDVVDQAIKIDDVTIMEKSLTEAMINLDSPEIQKLFIDLLQRAISSKSTQSIKYFLENIRSLEESDDIYQRNCVHRLVISICRSSSTIEKSLDAAPITSVESTDDMHFLMPASIPEFSPIRSRHSSECDQLSLDNENAKLLDHVLTSIKSDQHAILKSRDAYGRMPLHYAAQSGLVVICELIMKYMREWNLDTLENGIDSFKWQDDQGFAPLHLSILGGHLLTTRALLNYKCCTNGSNKDISSARRILSESSTALALATKLNFIDILKLLIDASANINQQDEAGETALHIAARFGHADCAEELLRQKANFELVDKKFSWTPLHVACVDGHLSIVELLIQAGADLKKPDASGWTAKEHAALRGHMEIARRILSALPNFEEETLTTVSTFPNLLSVDASSSLNHNSTPVEPIKTFGHRFLTNDSMILVSLGSTDMRKKIPAIKLEKIPIAQAHSTLLDTALSVIVHPEGAQGEPVIIDLPVHDRIITEPIVFTTSDAAKVKLYFDIVPKYSGSRKDKVGRGVALLSSIKQAVGSKRMNLRGDLSVPILGTNLEVIGIVNFNFLIITPFSHPNMSINTKQTYWKQMSTTMLIGHRGLGKNVNTKKSLQLGENTLQSFIAAASLGANYVEFDVQLTKDHVPVIYHDFLVSETGIDAPVHTLTLEQFLHVNDKMPQSFDSPTLPRDGSTSANFQKNRDLERQRSRSFSHSVPESNMSERMKHTRDFKQKGYKANSRGNFIQAPFTTLEEMFIKLPEDVGFNIEMKYPMLYESEDLEMDTYVVELNSFVDTILTKVYDLGKKRKIIFSSFNPEICLLLSFKQPSIPILFLTDAGTNPVSDIRASSLHEAIRFASRWNLLGIVSAAEPLCNSPSLVKVVKENGLVCVSYGTLNNDPAKVQQQVNQGIDAVIVDSVLKIRNGLIKNAENA